MSGPEEPFRSTVNDILNQLNIARNEISNLRKQIKSLRHAHINEINEIQEKIRDYKCENCQTTNRGATRSPVEVRTSSEPSRCPEECVFPVIGVINTWYTEKRGIPRQSCLDSSKGSITLNSLALNNPEYALEGLSDFSHLWVLYHFHKHDSTHVRAKVAPPRLNGTRVGVFCTRSPHRPSPIGLSLVQVDQVVGNTIFISGVDMLDGTPVIDLKPYISLYDDPSCFEQRPTYANGGHEPPENDIDETETLNSMERQVEGGISDDELSVIISHSAAPVGRTREEELAEGREAPDGEEETGAAAVRVPSWVTNPPVSQLSVMFNKKAITQLEATSNCDVLKSTITNVLKEDPRSVYLRKKLGNQFYTFFMSEMHVSCKFDDAKHVVTVYQVKPARAVCECGVPEWQCETHSQ